MIPFIKVIYVIAYCRKLQLHMIVQLELHVLGLELHILCRTARLENLADKVSNEEVGYFTEPIHEDISWRLMLTDIPICGTHREKKSVGT